MNTTISTLCPFIPKEIWFNYIINRLDGYSTIALGRSTKFFNANILDISKTIWGRSLNQEDKSLLSEKGLLHFVPILRIVGRLTKYAYYINLFKEDKTFNKFFTDLHKSSCLRKLANNIMGTVTTFSASTYLIENKKIDQQNEDIEIISALSIQEELHNIEKMDSYFLNKIYETWYPFCCTLAPSFYNFYKILQNFPILLKELANLNSLSFLVPTLTISCLVCLRISLYFAKKEEKSLYELCENEDFLKQNDIDIDNINKNIFRDSIDRGRFHLKFFAPIFCLFFCIFIEYSMNIISDSLDTLNLKR